MWTVPPCREQTDSSIRNPDRSLRGNFSAGPVRVPVEDEDITFGMPVVVTSSETAQEGTPGE